jgi:hypothetical protein
VRRSTTSWRRARPRGAHAAAAALERLDPPPVEAIAEHLWLAADVVPASRAVPYLRAAADEATAVLAYEQAETHLQRALSCWLATPTPTRGPSWAYGSGSCR